MKSREAACDQIPNECPIDDEPCGGGVHACSGSPDPPLPHRGDRRPTDGRKLQSPRERRTLRAPDRAECRRSGEVGPHLTSPPGHVIRSSTIYHEPNTNEK